MAKTERLQFEGTMGKLAARLDLPNGKPRAFSLFAHCFTCSKDFFAASRIAGRLTEAGYAVLRFDFTGLGASDGEFENTNFTSNIEDLVSWIMYSSDSGQNWRNLSSGTTDTSLSVDFDELPGSSGTSLIRVLVSDGALTGESQSFAFTVAKHNPKATIVTPVDGQSFGHTDVIALRGNAVDLDDPRKTGLSMQWTSSLDGVIGDSESHNLDSFSLGQHQLDFVVEDADGNISTDTIQIRLYRIVAIYIVAP